MFPSLRRLSQQGRTAPRTARDLALLTALTLAIHLPFVRQAIHIDDVYYLEVGRNVFRNPFFPLDLQFVFEGKHLTLWAHSHPPLNAYVIAGVLALGNGTPSETLLHTSFLFFPILISVAFYFLARQFVARPLLATALLATNPVLMVCAHTLMTDVPLLAMWLCGSALFVVGLIKDKSGIVYAAAIPLTAACFYAYQGLGLILLLGFYALSRGRLRSREILVLCTPVLFIGVWQFGGYMHRGTAYAAAMFDELGRRGWGRTSLKIKAAASTFAYLGGIILPFPFIFWKIARAWKGTLILVVFALALLLAYSQTSDYSWPQKTFFVLCFTGGAGLALWSVGRVIADSSSRKFASDDLFLGLWFIGIVAACCTVFLGGIARYLLPACPALILLFLRANERAINTRSGIFYGSLLALQLILGLCLAQADYQFAETGRRGTYEFQRDYVTSRQPFLFSGEWGFRYYMTAAGGEIMAEDTRGVPGEIVVKSRLSMGGPLDSDRSLQQLEQRRYRIRSPFRLLDVRAHAGFWSDGWGVLPFWFSREDLDEISIYRVKGN